MIVFLTFAKYTRRMAPLVAFTTVAVATHKGEKGSDC
jgi:hypothetical protein